MKDKLKRTKMTPRQGTWMQGKWAWTPPFMTPTMIMQLHRSTGALEQVLVAAPGISIQ